MTYPRHTHDYKRHGVLDLYAALNLATGEAAHACSESHTAADFVALMKLVARQDPRRPLHVVLDNSSTHSTPEVTKVASCAAQCCQRLTQSAFRRQNGA
jgi:hypothetical protein